MLNTTRREALRKWAAASMLQLLPTHWHRRQRCKAAEVVTLPLLLLAARLSPMLDAPRLPGPDSRPDPVVHSAAAPRAPTPRVLTLAAFVTTLSRVLTTRASNHLPARRPTTRVEWLRVVPLAPAQVRLLLHLQWASDVPHCGARAPRPFGVWCVHRARRRRGWRRRSGRCAGRRLGARGLARWRPVRCECCAPLLTAHAEKRAALMQSTNRMYIKSTNTLVEHKSWILRGGGRAQRAQSGWCRPLWTQGSRRPAEWETRLAGRLKRTRARARATLCASAWGRPSRHIPPSDKSSYIPTHENKTLKIYNINTVVRLYIQIVTVQCLKMHARVQITVLVVVSKSTSTAAHKFSRSLRNFSCLKTATMRFRRVMLKRFEPKFKAMRKCRTPNRSMSSVRRTRQDKTMTTKT